MTTKTISVNPAFFNNKKGKTKKKLKHSLRTNFNKLQKNFLKEKMIDKIKTFKNKTRKRGESRVVNPDDFGNQYDEAMGFMEDIIQKKKKKRKKKRGKRDTYIVDTTESDNIESSSLRMVNSFDVMTPTKRPPVSKPSVSRPPVSRPPVSRPSVSRPSVSRPPSSILKKKSKYNKASPTLAFVESDNFGKEIDMDKEITDFAETTDRREKLKQLKKDFSTNENFKERRKEKFKIKSKKIIKKFTLGKNNTTRRVGILIKNKQTRKIINKDCKKLHKQKLSTVKKYLVDHSFIKVGTVAPEKLLRNMYEDSYLSGNVKNTGGKRAEEILMHNWKN